MVARLLDLEARIAGRINDDPAEPGMVSGADRNEAVGENSMTLHGGAQRSGAGTQDTNWLRRHHSKLASNLSISD